MKHATLALALCLSACGGGSPLGGMPYSPPPVAPPAPPEPGSPPALPPPPPPSGQPGGAEVASTLPGPSFGVQNATAEPVVWFGWWETRIPQPVTGAPEPGWVWIIPSTGSVAPGATYVSSAANGPYPRPQPEDGADVDVVAVGLSGATYAARIPYAVPASAVWVVRP